MLAEEKILNAKILIVDDNILNIQILKKILTEEGFYHITTTTDPLQAVQLYKDIHPDLLLLDYNMPGKNGVQIIVELRSLNPSDYLPVLMLTAEEDTTLRAQALQSGAKDFLRKPYDRLEVVLRSRNILEVRMLYAQALLQNRSLEDQVNDRTKELRDTRMDVIQRLARMAEFRDKETGLHIVRMSRYCLALAKTIGLTPSQCDLILATSPLHDIGKIAIPDSILLKPTKLDVQEYEIMKTHAMIGSQLLLGSNSTFLKMASIIAQTHHERWDGSGYPNQIKGEDIPLVGRICAVCDVFDALTSNRPYKKAWGFDESLTEIINGKGKHFDPKLVEAFLDIKEDIKYIYEIYQ